MIKAFFLLQADVAGAAEQMAESAGELKMPFFEVAQKGGWLMLPIVVLSMLAVYIFFERYFAIKTCLLRANGLCVALFIFFLI